MRKSDATMAKTRNMTSSDAGHEDEDEHHHDSNLLQKVSKLKCGLSALFE